MISLRPGGVQRELGKAVRRRFSEAGKVMARKAAERVVRPGLDFFGHAPNVPDRSLAICRGCWQRTGGGRRRGAGICNTAKRLAAKSFYWG